MYIRIVFTILVSSGNAHLHWKKKEFETLRFRSSVRLTANFLYNYFVKYTYTHYKYSRARVPSTLFSAHIFSLLFLFCTARSCATPARRIIIIIISIIIITMNTNTVTYYTVSFLSSSSRTFSRSRLSLARVLSRSSNLVSFFYRLS